SKLVACARQSSKSGSEVLVIEPVVVERLVTNTSSLSGSRNGSGRSTTARTTLKIAVFAPTPSASVRVATAAKPGFLRRRRSPRRTSLLIRLRTPLGRGAPQGRWLPADGLS